MMKYKGYLGKVEFDADADILHGEVVGIRDVVTFQGRSVKEIEKAFRDSVDDYLAFCKERGESPNRTCSGHFVLRIDSELHRKAEMLASASSKSLNAWVADCLSREVTESFPTLRLPKAKSAKPKGRSASRTTATL
jgi:predicted HicB family RNase H-like nuclease